MQSVNGLFNILTALKDASLAAYCAALLKSAIQLRTFARFLHKWSDGAILIAFSLGFSFSA
jgi:hypothetical protein